MPLSIDLRAQRILVVGASSGLGRAVGRMASEAGASVALAARRTDRLASAVAECPGKAIAVSCDVRVEEDCARAVAETVNAYGGLDGLVYCAGMSPLVPIAEATQAQWRQVFDTNMIGAALVTKAALPHLAASHGRCIYLSSFVVRRIFPGLALYRASKLALDGMIQDWREEHPDLDFVRVIVGNTVGTEFGMAWDPARMQAVLQEWTERKLTITVMPIEHCAEAILTLLATRGYVDDVAVMARPRDIPSDAVPAINAAAAAANAAAAEAAKR